MKRLLLKREHLYVGWAWLLLLAFTLNQTVIAAAQTAPPMQLRITILDGEGALNNIRERTAREPIVQVEDENHKPVAGALVLFTINGQSGAGATFANSLATYQTTTDAMGRATAKGLLPNNQAGEITIAVTATVGALTASAVIHQQNVDPGPSTSPAKSHVPSQHHSPVNLGNVALVGAAAAFGVILGWTVATRGSGSSNTTITAGTSGVGAPAAQQPALPHR